MFRTGDLISHADHINLIPNPLIGPNIDELGTRFPDMSEPYSRKLIALSDEVARKAGIPLQHGCYIGVTGPTFETQKEYSFYRTAGADTVAFMSTTPEVIAARHMGLPVFAVSIITNMGLAGLKSTHDEEVQAEGAEADGPDEHEAIHGFARRALIFDVFPGRTFIRTERGVATGWRRRESETIPEDPSEVERPFVSFGLGTAEPRISRNQ